MYQCLDALWNVCGQTRTVIGMRRKNNIIYSLIFIWNSIGIMMSNRSFVTSTIIFMMTFLLMNMVLNVV